MSSKYFSAILWISLSLLLMSFAAYKILVKFGVFLRQGFSLALEPVLELALIDQAGLKLIEIRLPLPLECWD